MGSANKATPSGEGLEGNGHEDDREVAGVRIGHARASGWQPQVHNPLVLPIVILSVFRGLWRILWQGQKELFVIPKLTGCRPSLSSTTLPQGQGRRRNSKCPVDTTCQFVFWFDG